MICWTLPEAEGNILSEGPTYNMVPESPVNNCLLYLHWFRIKYSIQTIHKQTDHDQTGLNLDELILDEFALVLINSYTITPVHVIQVVSKKLTQLGTN